MQRKYKLIVILYLSLFCRFHCLHAQNIKDTSIEYINRIESDSEAIIKINELLANKNNSIEIRANLQMKLASSTTRIQKFEQALKITNEFIIEQEAKISTFLPQLYNTKARAYYYMFNVEKAIEALEIGLKYAEKNKDYTTYYTIASNIGGLYADRASVKGNKNDFAKAENILQKSLKVNEEQNKEKNAQYFLTKRILAIVYQATNRKKEAEKLFVEAIEGFTIIKEFGPAYSGALIFYARLLSEMNRGKEAFTFLQNAIEIQRKSNNLKDLSALFYVAASIYKDAGQKEMAFSYMDSAYRNQLKEFENVQTKAIATSEAKFGNEILKRDVEIANQKKQRLVFISSMIAALAIITFLSLYLYQKKKDIQQKLKSQKQTIDAYLEGEEKEKVRLSRELHDGIAQDLLALRFTFQKQGLSEINLQEIDKIGAEVRDLSHQLMPLTLKMLGLVPAMEEMCNKLFPPCNIDYELVADGFEQRLSSTLEISLYRISQELVQNIIKHSNANHVLIQLIKKNNYMNLIVEDNGLGFDDTNPKQGIGLHNLQSRVQLINGQLRYESAKGDGTTTIVRVPLS
jgi:signal transduction histidine kinase